MSAEKIILLVALKAEAKPLTQALGLRREQPDGAFPRYINGPLTLVLTGPGAEAARQATRFALSLTDNEATAWINLGIAGHASLAPGCCLLAESVKEISTNQEWTLQPPDDLPEYVRGSVHAVPEPENDYTDDVGYDMESAAIADSLSQAGHLQKLQVLKIISDNPQHPARGISARIVSELIQAQLPLIENLISRLRSHA